MVVLSAHKTQSYQPIFLQVFIFISDSPNALLSGCSIVAEEKVSSRNNKNEQFPPSANFLNGVFRLERAREREYEIVSS